MAHRLLWVVAIAMAATALVAGCLNVSVPEGPYVVAGNTTVGKPSPATQARFDSMDRKALENEILRLSADNDNLRIQNENLKREVKVIKGERDRYKDENDNLRDQVKRLTR
jgi:hypothetical protein